MLVVSDATPLNILVRIQCIDALPRLFRVVVIPTAVAQELSHERTPKVVWQWLAKPPAWLRIEPPKFVQELPSLGLGEREAISLAAELDADLLLADDKGARRAARQLGINVTGTLGILEEASRRGLVDLPSAIDRLRATDFFLSEELIEATLQRGRPTE